MRRIAHGVYIENRYPTLYLGLVAVNGGILLIDNPIRLEDGRAWLHQIAEYGKPLYTVLLDHHPDRVIGARDLIIPIVGHQVTSQILGSKSDSFKGSTHPVGAETDRLKRVTGVSRAIPNLTFTDRMTIRMNGCEIELIHKPGPTEGSIWVVLHEEGVIFIGDTVTVAEPPFLGEANTQSWLEILDELRASRYRSYQLISSRDGMIEREEINVMARFIRKVRVRMERLAEIKEITGVFTSIAEELLSDYPLIGSRKDRALLRLRVGMEDLYHKTYDVEIE
jgi:glyoxylase-like metal-dependent hydrolase (beta-lactamase superfamily II)